MAHVMQQPVTFLCLLLPGIFQDYLSIPYLAIQDLIWRSADMLQVLRLLVLFSATNNGIPRKQFDALRMEFLAAYGHQHLLTLNNLEKSGW